MGRDVPGPWDIWADTVQFTPVYRFMTPDGINCVFSAAPNRWAETNADPIDIARRTAALLRAEYLRRDRIVALHARMMKGKVSGGDEDDVIH